MTTKTQQTVKCKEDRAMGSVKTRSMKMNGNKDEDEDIRPQSITTMKGKKTEQRETERRGA